MQGERQPNRESSASLYQFKLGKEKERKRQDNESLENNSTKRQRKERREKPEGWERGEETLPEYLQYDNVLRRDQTAQRERWVQQTANNDRTRLLWIRTRCCRDTGTESDRCVEQNF